VRKKQTIAAKRFVTNPKSFLIFGDSSLESASIFMCLFSFVANAAPRNPTHKTRCRKNISPQRIEVEKKFLRITCKKAIKIIDESRTIRNAVSMYERKLSIFVMYFTF